MAYIKTDENNRIASVTMERLEMVCYDDEIEMDIPEDIPFDKIHDYLYIDGEFIYSPQENTVIDELTYYDKIEAQVLYTAMMTDTLMEG